MIEIAENSDSRVTGMAVSRDVCVDCIDRLAAVEWGRPPSVVVVSKATPPTAAPEQVAVQATFEVVDSQPAPVDRSPS